MFVQILPAWLGAEFVQDFFFVVICIMELPNAVMSNLIKNNFPRLAQIQDWRQPFFYEPSINPNLWLLLTECLLSMN